ncbi:MAG: 2OG-Fe(II) oxygenase [Bacteroidetes bacterium]|nr:2OG-Fe(II) oxygenase [Bacteroidota bacterium]
MNLKIDEITEAIYANGYSVINNFFDEATVSVFLEIFRDKTTLIDAGTGKENSFTKNAETRSDKISWIDKGTNPKIDSLFFKVMEDVQQALNRRCYLGLNASEFHFAKYEPGTFYKRHKDIFNSDSDRKISVILYLNNNWKQGDGGELKLYMDTKTITVAPVAGTLVLFESHYEHEVLLSNINRYSITGWLKNMKTL